MARAEKYWHRLLKDVPHWHRLLNDVPQVSFAVYVGLFCRIRRAILPYMFLARPRSLAHSLSRVRALSLARVRSLIHSTLI